MEITPPKYDDTLPVEDSTPHPSYEDTVAPSAAIPSYEDTEKAPVTPALPSISPAEMGSELQDSITIEQLQAIANKRGVPIQKLASAVPYYNMSVSGLSDKAPERLAGVVSESYGGLATKVHRMMQDPAMEAALDDIAEYAQEHKSAGMMATEMGVGLLAPAGIVAKGAKALQAGKGFIKGGALGGALLGAAEGVGRSREGEELETGAKYAAGGALVGVALGGALAGAAKGIGMMRDTAVDALLKVEGKGMTAKAVDEMNEKIVARTSRLRDERPGLDKAVVDNASLGSKADVKAPVVTPEYLEHTKARISRNEVSPDIVRIVEKNYKGDDIPRKIAEMEHLSDLRDFAKYLGAKKNFTNDAQIRQVLARHMQKGPEFLAEQYSDYLRAKALRELIKENIVKKMPRTANFISRATLFVVDGAAAHRLIDDRLGTTLQTTLDDFTSKQNVYREYLHSVLSDEAFQGAKKALKEAGEGANEALYRALDTKGGRETLSPTLQPVYDTFRDLFDKGAAKAKKDGLKLDARADYIPYKIQDTMDLLRSMETEIAKLPEHLQKGLRDKSLDAAGLEALKAHDIGKEIVQAVSVLSATKPSATPQHFLKRLATIMDPRMLGEKVETSAKSAYMREGDIPLFIREKNVAKLYSMWNQDTFRHLSMRSSLAEMKAAAQKAVLLGDEVSANYIINHMKDLVGVRRGTAASWFKDQRQAFTVAMTRAADKAEEGSLAQKWYKGWAMAPELAPLMFNQIYPNFLGLSPRAALMNAAQPFLMTVPELGYRYGTPRILNAYRDMASLLAHRVTGVKAMIPANAAVAARLGVKEGDSVPVAGLLNTLKGTSRTPVQFQAELLDSVSRGISESSLYKGIQKPLEKWNDFAMSAFTAAETANRMAASLTGLGVAQDILGRNGARMQAEGKAFVERMGSGYRRSINAALAKGDNGRVSELLQNYLISKTIFNYNRATMSEYGRFMGPMLSTFTKWPLAIAGDVVQNFSRGDTTKEKIVGGVSKTAHRYMAPLALLYAANAALQPHIEDEEWAQRILGKKGLVGLAPIGAVADIVGGELPAPPVVSVIRGIGEGLATADAYQLYRVMNDAFAAFTPVVPALADMLVGLNAVYHNEPKPSGTLMGKISQAAGADTNPDEAVRDFTEEIRESLFGTRPRR